MGANDVSNATGVFLSTVLWGSLAAGLIGGAGLALGVLICGKPLLERVAFDMVRMDLPMATAAQLVQALVVLTAVSLGQDLALGPLFLESMDVAPQVDCMLNGFLAGVYVLVGLRGSRLRWPSGEDKHRSGKY